MTDDTDLVAQIEALGDKLAQARDSINRRFIGQKQVVDLTLTAMLCGGHALLIGLPGLGKTRLVDTLSTVMGLQGSRIQFTPDLMPADILGSEILDVSDDGKRAFRFVPGPIFCQLLMADEINRASPRTQAALLQAKSLSQAHITNWTAPFTFWRPRTRSNRKAPIPCPKPSLTGFWFRSMLCIPTATRNATS
jgi:MoxR-like ATPase